MTQIISYVSANMIYKDINTEFNNFRELVSQLSCSDALFWCARINLILNENGMEESQEPIFKMLTTAREKYWLNKTIKKNRIGNQLNIYFFRGQMLELMRWIVLYCQDHPDDSITFDNKETRVQFFKCALLASDIWSNQTQGKLLNMDPSKSKLLASGLFRKSMEASKSSPDLYTTCGRGWLFYHKYFIKHFSSFIEDFLVATKLTFEEYMICFVAFATHFINPLTANLVFNIKTIGNTTLISEKIGQYIQLESQNLGDLRNSLWNGVNKDEVNINKVLQINTNSIRTKPIYSTPDGRAVILDTVFFHERVLVGPLFHLINLAPNKANQIFEAFGNAFEEYCFDILGRMQLGSSGTLICNRVYTHHGHNLEIEAAWLDGRKAILFEIKASFLKETKINAEGDSFVDEIRKKYSVSESKGVLKIKGVGQLSRNIMHIIENKFEDLSLDFIGITELFPILLVHDNLLDAPLTIELLRVEFLKCLELDLENVPQRNKMKIWPLTVMTITDLECLENSTKHYNILNLLREYTSGNVESLHNFIAGSKKYGYYRNITLVEASIELFEKARIHLFPQQE